MEALVIAPVRQQGKTLIPLGTKVSGTIQEVKRVGLGLLHETARISIDFDRLTLPDGRQISLQTKVTEIDNARESVDRGGDVKGIRSTGTLGYRANNLLSGFAMFDPIAYLYVNVAAARMLRFSEPEIWFPAATELRINLVAPIKLQHDYGPATASIEQSAEEGIKLRELLRGLPYRTMTANSNKPSDFTNLVFLGTPRAVERAFRAAGWVRADRLNSISTFLTLRSIAENQRYQSAPMSTLLLDEQRPAFTLQKSLDTFSKRHHARVWLRSETWNGHQVLTASSTQDIGIQLSRKNKTFIHVIDTNIDNERTKIVNDLIFTGCVAGAQLYPRPWLPTDAYNGTGEKLETDRRVAVLEFNQCDDPQHAVEAQAAPDKTTTGNTVERGFRQGILITRNDLYRGNLLYQGYEGTKMGVHYLKHRNDAGKGSSGSKEGDEIPVAVDEPLTAADSANNGRPRPSTPPVFDPSSEMAAAKQDQDKPPLFEIGLAGGWLHFSGNLAVTSLSLQPRTPENQPISLLFGNQVEDGWAAGTAVTLNSWRYFSNEFSFFYQRGKYRLGAIFVGLPPDVDPGGYQEETTGLLTNQFGYAFVFNLRPREKRFRPYVLAGPAFQLLHITDSPFKSSGGVFKVGLRNVGLILAAYNFASKPPLDGGGVFQFGFQYGGGIKYRIARHWLVRLDYQETLSAQPDFVERSLQIGDPSDSDEYTLTKETQRPSGPLREQRLTAGFSFVF